jgi:hypothetical protein
MYCHESESTGICVGMILEQDSEDPFKCYWQTKLHKFKKMYYVSEVETLSLDMSSQGLFQLVGAGTAHMLLKLTHYTIGERACEGQNLYSL